MGLHDLWYKNAIIYCLDVETYADSDADGIGDFTGLIHRLDYLSGLGVTCLWLMPCYPTPNRDDGYDVADYCSVDPRLGSMADFAEFVLEARERGIHVILDLVPNHTSIEHPWFQAARRDPSSPFRDFYVWRTDDPGDTSDQVVFPGEQQGIWTYDDLAGSWYLHHFYPAQPDLNYGNPRVRDEFRKVIGLWLQQGVQGFRIDAAPFLESENPAFPGSAHDFLRELREFAGVRAGNAILLGEVDVGLSTLADYFGGGNQLHALFNFPLNRYVFLALAQESADPVRFGLMELPSIPGAGQWVNFLRHHDELNLSRLPADHREQIYSAFGPEPDMQIYQRGLRRRLAPMLGGDGPKLRLAYSLLFSLPGAPMIFYGEEIGMGENLAMPGRLAVRTPMQWTPYDNGGFSIAPRERWVRQPPEGPFAPECVSVAQQRGERGSLLNWMAGLIRTRRECGEIGTGEWKTLDTGSPAVLALHYDTPYCAIVTVNNLSGQRQSVDLALSPEDLERATILFSDAAYQLKAGGTFRINPYGYLWLRVGGMY